MECRKCGACCIAPSIASAMPQGKLAGVRCRHLDDRNLCMLFGRPERPSFCLGWKPSPDICGANFDEAMANIAALEARTAQ